MPVENKGHIAIIDDDPEMRALLQGFLSAEGYHVTLFSLAAEAFTALRDHCLVDVIITDLRMAGMDGIEFIKKMQEAQPDVPVVLITAFASIDSAIEALKNGAYHYLVKPLKLPEVSLAIEKALERRKLKKDIADLRVAVQKSLDATQTLFEATTQDFPTLDQLEERYMRIVLQKTSGRKDKAARMLGINRRTLYRKERVYGFVETEKKREPENSL